MKTQLIYRSGTVNSNMVNSKFHLIQSYCQMFFYHFSNISCLKCTVNLNFHLIQSKTLLTNDFEMRSFHLSLSQPLPQPVEPQPNVFFLNYELTKENLSPKTDNICIDSLYQQYQTMKGAMKCFQLR